MLVACDKNKLSINAGVQFTVCCYDPFHYQQFFFNVWGNGTGRFNYYMHLLVDEGMTHLLLPSPDGSCRTVVLVVGQR